MKNFFIILLLGTGVHSLSIPFISNIMDVVNLVTDISDIAMGRHDLTAGNLFKKKVDPTLVRVNELSEQISQMTNGLHVKMDKIMAAVLEIPRSIRFANLMSKLVRFVTRIDELFDDYTYYVHKFGNFSQYIMEDFSRVTTSHKFGDVQDILRQLYHLFIPGELDQREESLLDLMTDTLRNTTRPEMCNQVRTVQQQLYNLYETVVLTEIKGFIMSTYSFGLLSVYHNASFDNEIKKATGQTVFRSNQYLKAVAGYLVGLPRDLFLCDPQKHIKGKNYIAFGSIHQVITHNSMMFGDSWHCLPCEKIDRSSYYRDYSFAKTYWAPTQPCHGHMNKCIDLGWSEFCELNSTSDRAYTHLKSQHKGDFGDKEDDCKDGKRFKLDVWQLGQNHRYRWCTTCLCDCSEDHGKSGKLRAISLSPQIADFDNNMIVTGVRFVEQDYLIHLQIEQGKLLSYGQIDKKTIKLKELERFQYDGRFKKIVNGTAEKVWDGEDYHLIKTGQQEINLDYLHTLEFGWVVTGLKIARVSRLSKSLQMEVHITPYNFTTGLLVPTKEKRAKWISYRDMPGNDQRTQYETRELDPPTKYNDHLPENVKFAKTWFRYSSSRKDIAQYTIPFLDSRLTAPSPRVPLEGISLIRRGRKNSGGFIGFELKTVDISELINPELSPEAIEMFKNDFENEISNVIEID